jgi:large subunit ribosomal protein L14
MTKGIAAQIPKALHNGSRMLCDDNSGARIVEIIGVLGWHGDRAQYQSAGIGSLVIVAVKKGSPQMKKKVERALIIRQKKEFRRANGLRVKFEDNAVVLVDDQGLPKGTEIKGAIAREVAECFPKVAAIAAAVV